jgi:outer membrane protein OmpA-like peptidoglycan-associated protein
MKTKPVFESFNAFVDFLKYDSVNEGEVTDWKGILSSLSGYLDADAKKAFQGARQAYDKAPTYQSKKYKGDSASVLKTLLTQFDNSVEYNIKQNKDSNNLQTAESTTTEVKSFTYNALINGKIKIATHSDNAPGDLAGIALAKADWVDINDFIAKINFSNLMNADTDPDAIDLDKKYGKWSTIGKTDTVAYSGPFYQDYISSTAGGLTIGEFGDGTDADKILPALNFKAFQPNKETENPIKNTLIMYAVGNVTQGGGDEIPDYFIKKDFVTETVPGETKVYDAQIDGGDAMFKQGTAEINSTNKEKIDKMITAALAPLAGSAESIEITGGASFEGGLEVNKKLVVERANSVKAYMEKLYPALAGKIKVNETDFSKIQPKDEKDKYEEWRKVHLKIKGVLQGDSLTIKTPININVDTPILADTVEIIQYAISFEYSIPNFKPAKK